MLHGVMRSAPEHDTRTLRLYAEPQAPIAIPLANRHCVPTSIVVVAALTLV